MSFPSAAACRAPAVRRIVLVAAACCLAGCSWPAPARPSYSSNQDADSDWAAGSNQPPTPATLYAMANILTSQGRDAEACFVLERIVREHPRFMPAYVCLAETSVRKRQLDQAMAWLSAGLKVSPNDPVLLNDVGMCWLLKEDAERAIGAFQQAVAAAPDEARYRGNLAMALGMLGRYDEALTLYEQVLPPADAHYNLAVICEARKDTVRAAQEYVRARIERLEAERRGRMIAPSASPALAPATSAPATSAPTTRPAGADVNPR